MFQFPRFAWLTLWIHVTTSGHDPAQVPPFGHPRISACLRLPEAFRSLPRPSSLPGAQASTIGPSLLDHDLLLYTPTPRSAYFAVGVIDPRLATLEILGIRLSKNKASICSLTSGFHSRLVEMTGFEPATPCVQSRCSTTELHPHGRGRKPGRKPG